MSGILKSKASNAKIAVRKTKRRKSMPSKKINNITRMISEWGIAIKNVGMILETGATQLFINLKEKRKIAIVKVMGKMAIKPLRKMDDIVPATCAASVRNVFLLFMMFPHLIKQLIILSAMPPIKIYQFVEHSLMLCLQS